MAAKAFHRLVPILGTAIACSNASSGAPPVDSAFARDLASVPADAMTNTCSTSPSHTTTDGTCNNIPYPATKVPFTVGTGAEPVFTGGTMVDGLYTAVKAEGWNTTTGFGRQMSIAVLNGGTTILWSGQVLNADGTDTTDGSALPWIRANLEVSASGSTLTLASKCGAGTTSLPATLSYTALATVPPRLILANSAASVTTYERQGCP